jgi:ABC-2 type transport system ATP-binding protein
LVKDGMTVFVTTAYLDEAERCNRVGLMHRGRLIRCDAPEALRGGLEESCYEVECDDPRAAREALSRSEEVLSVAPAGARLHVFLRAGRRPAPLAGTRFTPVVPSLEDVFIALIRKAEHG